MTNIQKVVNHYFETKGLSLDEVKEYAKTKVINYPRHVRSAKQLLELTGSVEKANEAVDKFADWAKDNSLGYTIDTVIKRFLFLDKGQN